MLTKTLRVENFGPSTAENVLLYDRLPPGWVVTSYKVTDEAGAIIGDCNTGTPGTDRTVSVDLTQWRMRHDGNRGGILLKEPLLASWSDEQASPAARLVVRWGMFPTQQDFQPGDYNWGLTAYGIPPGSRFDLEVVWMEDGERLSAEIADIFCAPDVDRLQ